MIKTEFCEKYPEEAFVMNEHNYISSTTHNFTRYSKYAYYIPCSIIERAMLLEKYFHFLDVCYVEIPFHNRSRRSDIDLYDFLITKFNRLEIRVCAKGEILLGSSHISPIAWMSFHSTKFATYRFDCFDEVIHKYRPKYIDCAALYISFSDDLKPNSKKLLEKLSIKYNISINVLLCIIISWCYDIVDRCGPDCHSVFDFFTNERFCSELDKYDRVNWKYAYINSFDKQVVQPLNIVHKTKLCNFKKVWEVDVEKIAGVNLEDGQNILTLEEIRDENKEIDLCPFGCD